MSTTTLTHCPYCSLNCGLGLTTAPGPDGREVVTGTVRWKESPLTGGALCAKGSAAWEQIHHPERLTTPLVRRGGRGPRGHLVPATWEEALDRAAQGFQRIRAEHGTNANAVLSGGSVTNELAYLVGKLGRLALGTPHVDLNGRMCMTSAGAAYQMAFGLDRAMTPLADLAHADAIVVIGANLSNTYPVEIPKLLAKARARGGRIVVIDPRAGRFVDDHDLWVPLRPGTDAIVALAVLREIAHRGAIDEGFVAARTSGLADALAAAETWTLPAAAAATGVDAAVLGELAGVIAGARRAMYLHARGAEQQVTGTTNVLAWINVALSRGHIGRKGSGINMLTGQRNGQGGREHGQRCDQLPGGRNIDDPADRAVVAERWGVPVDDLPTRGRTYVELLDDARSGHVAGMLLLSTNPLVSAPGLDATRAALANLEHLVVMDLFRSETVEVADVVLPATSFAEEEGTITTMEGRVIRVDAAVAPVAGRAQIDVLRNLANRLGAGRHFRAGTARQVYDELRAVSAGGPIDYAGITWERIRKEGGVFWPCPDEDHPGTPRLHVHRFAHADGRARCVPVRASAPPARSLEHPMTLTTGRVLQHYLSGAQTRRIGRHMAVSPEPVAEVHPDTASRLGLVVGQQVRLSNDQGTVTVSWAANQQLRPDTVFLPYHWPVANRLTSGAELDPISRIPNLKVVPVAVSPDDTGCEPPEASPPREIRVRSIDAEPATNQG